ncbi:MAG: murein biosynthesis integral membrane protein MurJ [Parachlamydiales bacterium]|nr:murein biosynthesis integral membrane protein MurJ [Parachlamydiales bacterium]
MEAQSDNVQGLVEDTPRSINRHATRFFSGTLVSRLAGFFRDVTMAAAFGAEPAVAAFMVAYRFANLLRRLFGEGALQTTFVPHFEALRVKDSQLAAQYFKDLLLSLSFVLVITIVGIESVLSLWLSFGSGGTGTKNIVFLTALQFPALLFISLFGLNSALLQCQQKYFLPGIAPVIWNCIWIVSALLLRSIPSKSAMAYLSVCIVIAFAAQWLITMPSTYKQLKSLASQKITSKLFSKEVRQMIKPLTLGMLGVGAAQINSAVDTLFARYADVGGPAYLWYALRIQQLPLALFGIAIAGALLPTLSRSAKAMDWDRYRNLLHYGLTKSMSLMLPATFYLLAFGRPVVSLLFGHGEFDLIAVEETTRCLWAYSLGLAPMTAVLLLAPALYSIGNFATSTRSAIIALVLNTVLNAVFIFGFNKGADSVAYATTISTFFNVFFLVYALRNHFIKKLSLVIDLSKIGVCSFLAWMTQAISYPIESDSFILRGIQLSMQSLIFLAALFGTAYVIKAEPLLQWMRILKRKH